MSGTFTIEAISLSLEKGTIKKPVPEVEVTPEGFLNDAHAGQWHRQISLLAAEDVERFSKSSDIELDWGEFAENITTRNIDLDKVAILDRIIFEEVELEITQIGKTCHHGCDIFKNVGACIMPKQGLFSRVISTGKLKTGMTGKWIPRLQKILIITLSDRASSGVYEDLSGPEIKTQLDKHFYEKRDHVEISRAVIPDDPDNFNNLLVTAEKTGVDLVITTGSTGLGPRDMAPEITAGFITRQLPGIMEHVRMKYGADKPGALLSRGLAGTRGSLFVINMPGSVKAVREYTTEFLQVWDHIRRMIFSIDQH
ncbi:molybdenum cofactor synthesis protein [bacterium]|nr:molybdenum cofactor synthesis protein [bacterium]